MPVLAKLAGFADTVVAVDGSGAVTVIAAVAVELAKLPDGVYDAVIVLLPVERAEPFTVRLAVALDPEADKVTSPKDTLLRVNATVPVGGALPLAGFTVAVN